MSFSEYDLRRHILRSPTHSIGSLFGSQVLSKAKVSQHEVAISPDEYILGLEISMNISARLPVDNITRMEVLNGEQHIRTIELSRSHIEAIQLA